MADEYGTPGETASGTDKVKEKAREARHKAEEVKDRAEEKAEEFAAEARDRGKEAVREGKEKARELKGEANRMAHSRAEEQKGRLVGGMRTVADALRHGTDDLPEDRQQYGTFLETVADRVDGVSRYLDERDVDGLTREARHFARDHTPLFLGGAFALGLAGARFLKSSGSEAVREPTWESGIRETGIQRTGPRPTAERTGSQRAGIPPATGGRIDEPGATPRRGSRTEEWTNYERDPAPPYPRSSKTREAADRIKEEGGYA